MLKVLYIIDTLQTGGAERSLIDLALHNKAIKPYFITVYIGTELAYCLETNGITVFQLGIRRRYAFNEAVKKMLPLIAEIKPDIIHSTLFRSDMIARKLKKHLNIPVINSFVSNSYSKRRYSSLNLLSKIKLKLVQLYDRFTVPEADFFIANSNEIRVSNSKALGINLHRSKVIYRGRNSMNFNNISNDRIIEARSLLNINDNHIILNVGRLLKSKGQQELIIAFSEVVKQYPKTALLIAGEGRFRSMLEKAIIDLHLDKHVLLLGKRDDIPVLLALADVFVFPSHYEGLPGAIIEGMFARKAIICSDIPENKECVSENEAVFFPKGDVSILTEKILQVLTHPAEYREMGNRAYETACEKFDIDSVVKQYVQTYDEIIDRYKK